MTPDPHLPPLTPDPHLLPLAWPAGTGLNYAAILDVAIDVAKAMLHLHCNNVLHGEGTCGA